MNKSAKKQLSKLYDEIESLREKLEQIKDQQQETYDNMSERVQESERGETLYEALDNLETAHTLIEEALENIDNAKGET